MNKLTPALCLLATILLINPAQARKHKRTDLNKTYLKFFNKYKSTIAVNHDNSITGTRLQPFQGSKKNSSKYLEYTFQPYNPNLPTIKIGKEDLKTHPKYLSRLWLHWQIGPHRGRTAHVHIQHYKRNKCLAFIDENNTYLFWLINRRGYTKMSSVIAYCRPDHAIETPIEPEKKTVHKKKKRHKTTHHKTHHKTTHHKTTHHKTTKHHDTKHHAKPVHETKHANNETDKLLKQILTKLDQQQQQINAIKQQLQKSSSHE